MPNSEPIEADRNGEIAAPLAQHRPDLLIDAAGPFQNSSYGVPLACARAAVPYLDLADARDFVCGIAALDEAARSSGVPIIAGASSVPALSGVVARRLAETMDAVRGVEIAISASNRATAGTSVASAILSYVGRPIRIWRGRRWTLAWGWGEVRRETFAVDGVRAVENRWVALADVPDLPLLPERLPGRPAVTFRAGTESALQTLGLWLLSWPIRWLRTDALARAAPMLRLLQRATTLFGASERSAMSVTLKGLAGDKALLRRWTLIADHGDGPEIPTLAAVLLAEKILAGAVPAGARDAGTLLTLDEFEPLFASLAIRHECSETPLPPPLYARIMGERFDRLPRAVRAVHNVCGDAGASGEAEVLRGRNPLTRVVAWVVGFPPAGRCPVHVGFSERGGVERWTRSFGAHSFSSRLREEHGLLVEKFGPLAFRFALPSDENGLAMRMAGWNVAGLPLPLRLAPRSLAREWEEDGRFRFDVPIALPLLGLLVHYRGWLEPVR